MADALTLAVAQRWADPAVARPMPPVLLSATRAMAGLLVVLVLLDLAAGTPVALGPLVAVAAALALVAGGLAAIGRLGAAGAAVDEAVRVVGGPVVAVARSAADGDAAAAARLEDLRAAWWSGPVDDPERARDDHGDDPDAGGDDRRATDQPWTVRAADDSPLWATNQLGDAVYGPGVLGIRDRAGTETIVVAPPDGARGWRRLVVLQMTGATRRLETDDRSAVWFAVAPTESPGARSTFLAGNVLGGLAPFAVAFAAAAAADSRPLAWALGAGLAFSVAAGVVGLWLIDRVARGACRTATDPSPDLQRRCAALRAAFDAEGPGGPGVVAGRRLLWDTLEDRGATARDAVGR